MIALKQITAITLMNLRSLPQRLGASLVIIIGIAGVVAVLMAVLATATGLLETVANAGQPDRVLVMGGGSFSEVNSSLSRAETLTVMDAPQVKKTAEGKALASAEIITLAQMKTKKDGTDVNVIVRGIGAEGLAIRPEITIVEGRMFQPAVREIMIGRAAQNQLSGVAVGQSVVFDNNEWLVVGVFATRTGDTRESQMLADAETLMSAYRRNRFQSVLVQLTSAEAFDSFKATLAENPALRIETKRESEYYAEQSKGFTTGLTIMAYTIAGVMAVGAMFGSLNVMHAIVSGRALEIATLRAIGFGATPVVVSIFVEMLLLAVTGAALGAALTWFALNGATNYTGAGGAQLAFTVAVRPTAAAIGVLWALGIGLMGALFPAIRAARLQLVVALQAR